MNAFSLAFRAHSTSKSANVAKKKQKEGENSPVLGLGLESLDESASARVSVGTGKAAARGNRSGLDGGRVAVGLGRAARRCTRAEEGSHGDGVVFFGWVVDEKKTEEAEEDGGK